MNNWKVWIESLKAKPFSALGLLVLLALPVTLLLVFRSQDTRSSAAAPDKLEAEAGVLTSTGVSKQSDTGASGGQYVEFSQSSGPTPTNPPPSGELKAFPTAVGWGKDATGGRGGEVRKVTNLNNNGTGSLRAAWEASGKATIIFEIAGTITVSSPINASSDKTIAGETAFRNDGQGITIKRSGTYGNPTVQGNLNNTIIRFLRFRPGPTNDIGECCGDALTATGTSQNTIIDHSSFSWGTDETVNFWGSQKYITFQNIIISEPLYFSTHMEGGVFQKHGFAFLSGSDSTSCSNSPSHITFFNTVIAHSDGRNPRIAGACAEHEIVNTLLYNWGHFGVDVSQGQKRINLINLYGINGNDTSSSRYITNLDANTRIYVKGVYDRKNNYGADGDWAAIGSSINTPASTSLRSTTPFDYPLKDYPKLTASQIKSEVTANAGANIKRDGVDTRIMNDIATGGSSGNMIDHPNEVGGWPSLSSMSSVPTDSDGDGIPNTYESSVGLNSNNSADGRANSGDGYTNLEKYLFSLTGDI